VLPPLSDGAVIMSCRIPRKGFKLASLKSAKSEEQVYGELARCSTACTRSTQRRPRRHHLARRFGGLRRAVHLGAVQQLAAQRPRVAGGRRGASCLSTIKRPRHSCWARAGSTRRARAVSARSPSAQACAIEERSCFSVARAAASTRRTATRCGASSAATRASYALRTVQAFEDSAARARAEKELAAQGQAGLDRRRVAHERHQVGAVPWAELRRRFAQRGRNEGFVAVLNNEHCTSIKSEEPARRLERER
jgi:hypothetical protein